MPAFQIVDQPHFPPSRCATCGGNTCPQGFIDTLAEHPPPVGRFYICGNCVLEAANLYGFLDPDRKQSLIDRLAEAATMVGTLEARIAELEESQVQVVSLQDALDAART